VFLRPFHSDRSWTFRVPPEELWTRIAATEHYCSWWPWLRDFDGAAGIEKGATWWAEVAPPLPYVVRFAIDFDRVEDGRSIDTTIDGDIRGWARLTVDDHVDGCHARLESSLAPANRVLRGFGAIARPLVEWGHDWVLDEGRRQFVQRAF
jgi:hypothetical protein